MSLKRYLKNVATVSPRATILDASRLMQERDIGAVVIVSDDGQAMGIVTDRDVAIRGVAEGRSPEVTPVAEIMTPSPQVLSDEATLDQAVEQMAERGHRRLPIVDGSGHVVGLVSLDDVVLLLGMELGNVARAIFSGMAARPVGQPGAERSR